LANATTYFKEIIREQETYSKLSGRSSKKAMYESAAMAREKVAKRARTDSDAEANLVDEVREYIARLSSEKTRRAISFIKQSSATRLWRIRQQQ